MNLPLPNLLADLTSAPSVTDVMVVMAPMVVRGQKVTLGTGKGESSVKTGLRGFRMAKDVIIVTVEVEMSGAGATTVVTDLVESNHDSLGRGTKRVWTK